MSDEIKPLAYWQQNPAEWFKFYYGVDPASVDGDHTSISIVEHSRNFGTTQAMRHMRHLSPGVIVVDDVDEPKKVTPEQWEKWHDLIVTVNGRQVDGIKPAAFESKPPEIDIPEFWPPRRMGKSYFYRQMMALKMARPIQHIKKGVHKRYQKAPRIPKPTTLKLNVNYVTKPSNNLYGQK